MATAVIFSVYLILCLNFMLVHCEICDIFVNLFTKNMSDINYDEYTNGSLCDCSGSDHFTKKLIFFANFITSNNKSIRCIRNISITNASFTVESIQKIDEKSEKKYCPIKILYGNTTNRTYFLNVNLSLYHKRNTCCVEESLLTFYFCDSPENPQKRVSRMVNTTGSCVFSLIF